MPAGTAVLLEKFCFKLYARDSGAIDLADAIPVFHRWIQNHTVEGLLIDVADYRHVPDGPGVILIGHEADYFLDRTEGALGLLYSRKRLSEGTPADRLRTDLRHALRACFALQQEPEFADSGLEFAAERLRFIVNDRLAAPNDDETLRRLQPDIEAFVREVYPGDPVRIERDDADPRGRFTLHITASGPVGRRDARSSVLS